MKRHVYLLVVIVHPNKKVTNYNNLFYFIFFSHDPNGLMLFRKSLELGFALRQDWYSYEVLDLLY